MTVWVAVCEAEGCDWRSDAYERHLQAVARGIDHRAETAEPGHAEHETWVRRADEVSVDG